MGLTNFPNGITSFGVPVLGGIGGLPFTGNWWFVDPVNGLDGNSGLSPNQALQTLYQAVNKAEEGNNDVIVLIGNGLSSGTARLSLASAQSINPAATAGTLLWNKDALHLVGVGAPTWTAQRARIAPPTGTYTQATFGSGNFVVVTGSGCLFSNVSLFHGFSTGGTNQICWTDQGQRNAYVNMDFGGAGDAASAADTGSRSFKLGSAGNGEMSFYRCNFGLDTVARSVANATVEFVGGTPRNRFTECTFPVDASASSPLVLLASAASAIDREQIFERCLFMNAINSGATTMTDAMSCGSSSPGGMFLYHYCTKIGITKWGDTNGLANCYVDGAAPTAATSGTAITPT